MKMGRPKNTGHCINHPNRDNYLKGLCAQCYSKSYRLKNKEVINKQRTTWRENNRNHARDYNILKEFDITSQQYDAKLYSQNNLCELCGKEFYGNSDSNSGGLPVLDHSHIDKKLRGFVHRSCNLALGGFKDDPSICRKAAEYLERYLGDL
jgi:Recombination endonuclease VII